jgi:hypothetical protein
VVNIFFVDFKLSPRFECSMLSSGLFPGVCSLNVNVSGTLSVSSSVHQSIRSTSYLLAYEDGTDRVFRNVGIKPLAYRIKLLSPNDL